jgi:GTPase involved in cell partitioning and DNA repair
LDSEDLFKDYNTIREELKNYNPSLSQKKEIVVLTKKDRVTEEVVSKHLKLFSGLNNYALAVSILDDISMKQLSDFLSKEINRK